MGSRTYFLLLAIVVLFATRSNAQESEMKKDDTCDTDEEKKAFHDCFDVLKNDMMQPPTPEDVNAFLCSDPHKDRLDCVIKKLMKCPDYVKAPDVQVFKNMKSGLTANDLLYVKSADEFCKCAPTNECLKKIETEKVGINNTHSKWNKLANREYICGIAREKIECVANSMPGCSHFLQYKYNKSMESSMMEYFNVADLEHASIFAEKHCKHWPNDKTNTSCVIHRSSWYSVEKCYDYMELYTDDKKPCGMRVCIEKAMVSCAPGSMDYFIDSANVFAEHKIAREKCPVSSSSTILATVTSLLFAIYVSKFL